MAAERETRHVSVVGHRLLQHAFPFSGFYRTVGHLAMLAYSIGIGVSISLLTWATVALANRAVRKDVRIRPIGVGQ